MQGKGFLIKAFVYNSKREESVDQFVFRFGIIHCVADSGVFGLLVHFPEHTQFQNNDWVTITGTVELSYYPPFKRQIPTVQVEKVKADQAPKINMSIVPFKKVGCFLIKWKQPTFCCLFLILLRLRRIKPKDSLFLESCGYSD